jgi:RNA polymerase sigma-70 factor (ECF subfamily)
VPESKPVQNDVWPGSAVETPRSCVHVGTFDEIYKNYEIFVRRICLRMLRNPVDAEDAAQEVFVHVFRKIHTFRGEAALSTWLYRLTTNTVLMQLRKWKKHRSSFEELKHGQEIVAEQLCPMLLQHDPTIDQLDLKAAIDLLPRLYKAAIVLHDLRGYRHKDIAKILGYSAGN